jgi:hypothetical protein
MRCWSGVRRSTVSPPRAKRALDILREEILRDLGLLGVPSIAELSPRLLVHSDPGRQDFGGLT